MTTPTPAPQPPPLPLRRTARKYAIQYLFQLDVGEEEFSDRSLQRFWEQAEEMSDRFGPREWRKVQEDVDIMVRGVLQRLEDVDAQITRFLRDWSLDRLAAVDRNILRLSAWELLYSPEKVPPISAINEAVDLAKAFGAEDSSAFINGVLDSIHKSRS